MGYNIVLSYDALKILQINEVETKFQIVKYICGLFLSSVFNNGYQYYNADSSYTFTFPSYCHLHLI